MNGNLNKIAHKANGIRCIKLLIVIDKHKQLFCC